MQENREFEASGVDGLVSSVQRKWRRKRSTKSWVISNMQAKSQKRIIPPKRWLLILFSRKTTLADFDRNAVC